MIWARRAAASTLESPVDNLAGATWEQWLGTEMQAVVMKYKALNDADPERLKVLRDDLAAARQDLGTR